MTQELLLELDFLHVTAKGKSLAKKSQRVGGEVWFTHTQGQPQDSAGGICGKRPCF